MYVYIYFLRHPHLNEGYVGRSCDPWRRYKEHLKDDDITPKTDWIRGLLYSHVGRPVLEILERVPDSVSFEKEREWTRKLIIDGCDIKNSTNRGIGIY